MRLTQRIPIASVARLIGGQMNRYASIRLRHLVDAAVGPRYEAVFLRLDVLAASPTGRCGCATCALEVARVRSAVLAGLPPVGAAD